VLETILASLPEVPPHISFAVRLGLEEALANARRHGNQFSPSKEVIVEYRVDPKELFVRITDEGSGFDPESVPDSTRLENRERPRGRGLLLMRRYMSGVTYSKGGAQVTLTKLFSDPSTSAREDDASETAVGASRS